MTVAGPWFDLSVSGSSLPGRSHHDGGRARLLDIAMVSIRTRMDRAGPSDDQGPFEFSRTPRWGRVVMVLASLALAFWCLGTITGRAPALGWRERSLVILGI